MSMDPLDRIRIKKLLNGKVAPIEADVELLKQVVITGEVESLVICETGTASLTNSLAFPFNNSKKSIALVNQQEDTNYVVYTEIQSATGNPGEILVSDKQINGFKLAHTGGATAVSVKYYVLGGLIP